MWEMRVVQLGFEQRAPVGCLQYFLSPNGTLRTFNYLPNGRYLAGHDYLLCVRQEKGMCGISYQPCTQDSFRIGSIRSQNTFSAANNSIPTTVITNTGNASGNVVPNTVSGSISANNNSNTDVIEGSGTGAAEPEMIITPSSSEIPVYLQQCRDRIIIPCDFEEFITVCYIQFFLSLRLVFHHNTISSKL